MTIRSFSSIDETQAPFDLPNEIQAKIFGYLNLKGLLKVELVCKIWFEVSMDHHQAWKQVAHQKKIPLDSNLPIRTQVLDSFVHYCKAARIIFQEPLRKISSDGSPAYVKLLIDAELVHHRGSKAPRISITNLLQNPNYDQPWRDEDDLETKAKKSIDRINKMTPECIARLQVGLETKATFDTTFFDYLEDSDFGFGGRVIIECIEKRCRTKTLLTPLSEEKTRLSLDFLKLMDRTKEASLPLVDYLFQITKTRSLAFQFQYYKSYAYSDIIKALAPIRVVLKEKKNIIAPLLANLTGQDWDQAFENFLANSGIDLEFKVKYPKPFYDMIGNLDQDSIQSFIDSMLLTAPNACTKQDLFIIQKINKCLEGSLI